MADLLTFARNIKRVADRTDKNVDRLVVETAGVVDQTLVLATPVDTGRARANWQAGLGSAVTEVIEEKDKNGSRTIDRNRQVISTRRKGEDIHLTNNLPYINRLNQGSSAQAPEGFVERAVAVGLAFIRSRKVLP